MLNLAELIIERIGSDPWQGTTTELCHVLGATTTPERLSRELSGMQGDLEARGVCVTRKRQAGTGRRFWLISRCDGKPDSVTDGVTVECDSAPDGVTVAPGHGDAADIPGLDCGFCEKFRRGWCLADRPKAINVRALASCPLRGPYRYRWPGSVLDDE